MPKQDKLEAMTEGGHILATILRQLEKRVEPGVKTSQIDEWARRLCLKHKVKPSFLSYQGYPAAVCVSVNDEVVHGLPGERIIKKGDLVSLDLGVFHKGYHTDAAITFGVGGVTSVAEKIIKVTKSALTAGINAVGVGCKIGDIGFAVQQEVERHGFGVVRVLVGHGVGQEVHENPLIPNFGEKGTGPDITEGMTLAIEPMVTGGNYEVYMDEDGWTYKTKDSSLSAHFEHTIYVSADGPIVLTK